MPGQELAPQKPELRIGIPAPISEIEAIGTEALEGMVNVDVGTLAGQAHEQSMAAFDTPKAGELPTFENTTGLAPEKSETPLSAEVREGVTTEIQTVGAVALGGESAAPQSRFGSLVESGKAFIASYGDPAVRKAAWNMVKREFIAIHRLGVNTLLSVADAVPVAGKFVPFVAERLKPLYTPDAKVSTGLKAGLKTAEWVTGGTVPSHVAPTLSQGKEDIQATYRAAQEFRAVQSEAMDRHRAKKAAPQAETPAPTSKREVGLAA